MDTAPSGTDRRHEAGNGIENPNSVQQMKQWLSITAWRRGQTKGGGRASEDAPAELQEVLSYQQLAKSSVRKYQAMENTVCADNRARGIISVLGRNADRPVFRQEYTIAEFTAESSSGS